jgi:hypothetical protein
MGMANRVPLIVLLTLAFVVSALPLCAQTLDDPDSIMVPERGSPPPKHKARRGSSTMVYPTPLAAPEGFNPPSTHAVTVPREADVPPPIVVPQTGRVLPNLPTIGSGPGGAETSQDRAVRCSNQAGIYGPAAGDRNAYVGGCINQ